jgi:chaperonin cofactor prefoldin
MEDPKYRYGGTNRELERDKYDLEFRIGNLEQELRYCKSKLQEINTELRRRELASQQTGDGEEEVV